MSVSASIDLTLNKLNPIEIILMLLDFGWKIFDNGKKVILPIQDDGMFNWQSMDLTDNEILEILSIKYKKDELIGVCISWMDSNIGGELLLSKDIITFQLNNNRIINGYYITDFDWYLSKVIPAFSDDLIIESIVCTHLSN